MRHHRPSQGLAMSNGCPSRRQRGQRVHLSSHRTYLRIARSFDYGVGMGKTYKWWWNGRWGRIARRDIKIYTDGGRWWLEDGRGGVEGTVRAVNDLDEAAAIHYATTLMEDSDGWQEMTVAR